LYRISHGLQKDFGEQRIASLWRASPYLTHHGGERIPAAERRKSLATAEGRGAGVSSSRSRSAAKDSFAPAGAHTRRKLEPRPSAVARLLHRSAAGTNRLLGVVMSQVCYCANLGAWPDSPNCVPQANSSARCLRSQEPWRRTSVKWN
jgi:hypothetical protein